MGMTMTEVDLKEALKAVRNCEVVAASRKSFFALPTWRRQAVTAFKVTCEPRYFFNLKDGGFVETKVEGGI